MSLNKTYVLFPCGISFSFFSLPGRYQVGLSRQDDLRNLKCLQDKGQSQYLSYVQLHVFLPLGHDILFLCTLSSCSPIRQNMFNLLSVLAI